MSLEKHPVCRGDLHGVFSCHEGRGLPCLPPDRPVTAGSAQPCSPGLLPARGASGKAGQLCLPPSSTSRPSTHTSSSPHSLPPTVKHTVFEPASPVPLQNITLFFPSLTTVVLQREACTCCLGILTPSLPEPQSSSSAPPLHGTPLRQVASGSAASFRGFAPLALRSNKHPAPLRGSPPPGGPSQMPLALGRLTPEFPELSPAPTSWILVRRPHLFLWFPLWLRSQHSRGRSCFSEQLQNS